MALPSRLALRPLCAVAAAACTVSCAVAAADKHSQRRSLGVRRLVACELPSPNCGSRAASSSDRPWRLAMERLPELVPQQPSSSSSSSSSSRKAAPEPSAAEPNLSDAWGPVSGVLKSLLRQVAPDTLPKALLGLNVLALHDAHERRSRDQGAEEVDAERAGSRESLAALLQEALRCMRMCTASYGRLVLSPGLPLDEARLTAMICAHVGLDPNQVSVPYVCPKARWLQPAHYVLYDSSRREAVVAVRGTLSVQDVVTDLGAEEVDLFVGGKAHRNMLHGACNVLRAVAPVLESLSGQVDTVTFTGHSLGGGVAAYLSLLFAELVDGQVVTASIMAPVHDRRSALVVRCFTYGSPGVCSLEVSRSLQDRVVSFCHADDVVMSWSFMLGRWQLLKAQVKACSCFACRCGILPAFCRPFQRASRPSSRRVGGEPQEETHPPQSCRRLVVDHLPRVYEVVITKAAARIAEEVLAGTSRL
ncbi:unnamed protein product [Polarella glacialis]|uniref:sn-1-specific diacylglycerol lipase n=1 Tax=Polarella glacialis TaxID=89957 RepID=A0A813I4N8_POLGL|nr:unnamed protein product [Polarella glacialis]